MLDQAPYLTALRKLLDAEINRPTPTRETISRLIESIPRNEGQAQLPGLASAQKVLQTAIQEELACQRQRVGQEVSDLLKKLMIPVVNQENYPKVSKRVSVKEASSRIIAYLNQNMPEPQTRQNIASQTGLSQSTTKRGN